MFGPTMDSNCQTILVFEEKFLSTPAAHASTKTNCGAGSAMLVALRRQVGISSLVMAETRCQTVHVLHSCISG